MYLKNIYIFFKYQFVRMKRIRQCDLENLK